MFNHIGSMKTREQVNRQYDERAYFMAKLYEYEAELKIETDPEAIKALLSCINMIEELLAGN